MALTPAGKIRPDKTINELRQQRATIKAVDYLERFNIMTDYEMLSIMLMVLGLVLIHREK